MSPPPPAAHHLAPNSVTRRPRSAAQRYIFRNPARPRPWDAGGLKRAYATTERRVAHLTRLVIDLLDVSRITRGPVELRKGPVNLAEVADQAVEMVTPAVEGDATRLTQVIFNLLNNAAKYTDPGGRTWLTVEREGDQAVVRVRDNGRG
jgi:signal transduction histidine kinase